MRNRLFHILEFCFHEACLGVDLRRYACAMNMADSALEMLDVTLFSRGIGGVVVACFVANGSDVVGAAPDERYIFTLKNLGGSPPPGRSEGRCSSHSFGKLRNISTHIFRVADPNPISDLVFDPFL